MNAVSEKPEALSSTAQSTPVQEAPKRGFARRVLRPAALLAVLLAGAVAANWWFTEGRFIVSTDNAYVQGDIAVLGPRVEGDVIAVEVANNQPVKAGDVLVRLDPVNRQALLDSARGTAAEAAAAVAVAERQITQQRAVVAQSEAMIASAQAELTRATAEAGRTTSLVGGGWTSRQTNDQAVADQKKAEAQLASTIAQRATAQSTLAVAEAQLVQARAHLETAQAQVRVAQDNLDRTILRAPFDGIVGNKSVRVGEHVVVGQQLMVVAPFAGQLYVVANFKETQLTHMRPGQSVVLTPDIDTSSPATGRVASLAPATGALFSLLPPENATGNFTKVVQRVPVRIAIDQPDAAPWLRAGLSVTAEVDTRAPDSQRVGWFGAAARTLGLH